MEQRLQTTHPAGTLIQERYVVEDLLGRGGFGAVYLVRDQQTTGSFAALKELSEQNNSEKQRLLAECEILQRLDHPSLPEVRGVFEQDCHMYMLMEYIAGPNLENQRKKQPNKRFSFPDVVTLIAPIIEAVTYLHQQSPPLMHRDIKPANMIVPENGERTMLVDFGIAKEYYADATTTAVRHCSPGYSAPEQYSSMGTDPRVDVYGLGATCYALLTGVPPADALQRMTKMASKGIDPLVPVTELVPDIPPGAAAAIQRSLIINYERRFSTPAAFWQAFTGNAPTGEETSPAELEYTTPGSLPAIFVRNMQTRSSDLSGRNGNHQHTPFWKGRLVGVLLLLLFILGCSALGFWTYLLRTQAAPVQRSLHPALTYPTPTKSLVGNYPALGSAYTGTLDNLLTHTTTNIALKNVQQSAQAFKGTFMEAPTNLPLPFSGVIDASKRLLFTIAAQASQPALSFSGTLRSDGTLVGDYCSVDASGQCSGNAYGLWSLSPA